jgi:hypothetical protein
LRFAERIEYSCTVPVQYRLDKVTIVTGSGTDIAQLARKQVLNPFPMVIAKSIAGSWVNLLQSRLCIIQVNFCFDGLFLLFIIPARLALRVPLPVIDDRS